ncbi:putative beta-lactamase [Bradyrhizobium sp. ORS 375]|uniref:serine hydrolase domain-containing protein n=1 Tax=Bradyrhizobium sp. (strain ORS 375) TaxID=566679 RepID=UPI0002405F9E|nr:serine hydrolase domain-containing protein [Bradyrhizobium sp. ORS 375]CCD97106.1 putative beta-lactamase [Bradyrhizobium sp. ORS 375]
MDRPVSRRTLLGALLAAPMLAAAARADVTSRRHLDRLRLDQVSAYFRDEVAGGNIPGAVVLVQQHGSPVLLQSFGFRDPASRTEMTADAIFRIYSMSKPITSVAAMMLVDDGRLRLDDPLSKFIPAFADVKVDGAPLERPITILDLLRHTSGITYGFYGETVVRRVYAHAQLFDGDIDNATFVERLAKLPLAEQPGTLWDYGHSTDVLGRVIEVASGRVLYQFEQERLLGPLGMRDTAFFLADPIQRGRIAEPSPRDWFDRPIAGLDDPIRPRRWQSGGAGMISSISDYARFAQMLLNGGELDGRRYLMPETVALMTRDHVVGAGIRRDDLYFPGAEHGFGLGFSVRLAEKPPLPAGEYGWDGVGGTFFFIDPADDLFVIVMMQAPAQRGRIASDVRRLVYEALA